MKKLKAPFKLFLLFLAFVINVTQVNAQKLPGIQKNSVWVPSDAKIDGKATEWGNKFEAYNSNNNTYYLVANDDKNLYFIMKMVAFSTINKMYTGGITVTLKTAGSKTDTSKVAVTYPFLGGVINNISIIRAHNLYNKLIRDSAGKKDSINDLIWQKNKQFDASYKRLKVDGIKNTDDPIVSIYNNEGIKVKMLLNNKFEYTYELAIPLKLLSPIINNRDKFKYNIQFNGMSLTRFAGRGESLNILYLHNATDFGGEYVLAKMHDK